MVWAQPLPQSTDEETMPTQRPRGPGRAVPGTRGQRPTLLAQWGRNWGGVCLS